MKMTREEFNHISAALRGKLTALAGRFGESRLLPFSAEDIVQEALTALWQLSEKNYPIRDYEAMAVTVTKNICISHYRKRRAGKAEEGCLSAKESGYNASDLVDARDIALVKEYVYRDLTTSQKEYLRMRNVEGLSLDEIAAATGKPKSSIKTTISTARTLMLEKLKKEVL